MYEGLTMSGCFPKNSSSSTVDNKGKIFYAQVPAVNKSTQNNSINNVSSLGNLDG